MSVSGFKFDNELARKHWDEKVDAWVYRGQPLPPANAFLAEELAQQMVSYELARMGILAA